MFTGRSPNSKRSMAISYSFWARTKEKWVLVRQVPPEVSYPEVQHMFDQYTQGNPFPTLLAIEHYDPVKRAIETENTATFPVLSDPRSRPL